MGLWDLAGTLRCFLNVDLNLEIPNRDVDKRSALLVPHRGAGAERDAGVVPDEEKEEPVDEDGYGLGQCEGHERAHASLLVVLLQEGECEGEVGRHWGDDFGGGIADAVGYLADFRGRSQRASSSARPPGP